MAELYSCDLTLPLIGSTIIKRFALWPNPWPLGFPQPMVDVTIANSYTIFMLTLAQHVALCPSLSLSL